MKIVPMAPAKKTILPGKPGTKKLMKKNKNLYRLRYRRLADGTCYKTVELVVGVKRIGDKTYSPL